MGLLKKKEIIDLDSDLVASALCCVKKDQGEAYYAEAVPEKKKLSLDLPAADIKNRALERFKEYVRVHETLSKNYYFVELFVSPAIKDRTYVTSIERLEMDYANLDALFRDTRKTQELYVFKTDVTLLSAQDFYNKVEELFNYSTDIYHGIQKIQRKYYQKIWLAAYSLLEGNDSQQLKALKGKVSEELKNYPDLGQAYDFVNYHSSELMYNTVSALVDCLHSIGKGENLRPEKFLGTSYALVLNYLQWISLFNRIAETLKEFVNTKPENYYVFKKNYEDLEIRYIIYLLWYEVYGDVYDR